jgi:hypothetical protein
MSHGHVVAGLAAALRTGALTDDAVALGPASPRTRRALVLAHHSRTAGIRSASGVVTDELRSQGAGTAPICCITPRRSG